MKIKIFLLFSFVIIVGGIATSAYLLSLHFSLANEPAEASHLCSTIFHKSCDAALMSKFSSLWGIPMGGWGLIYLTIISLFLIMAQWMFESARNEMVQAAFWISLTGVAFSIYYSIKMMLHPVMFCPFCLVFHVLNFILFFLMKSMTRRSFPELIKGGSEAIGFILLGRPLKNGFNKWKWLGFILPVLVGLIIYQRIRLEGLNRTAIKLASYDPLKELETFDTLTIHPFLTLPGEPLLGPAEAPVTLVVFSDFQCPVCKMFAANLTELINYNKGKLNIRFKYFPLSTGCNPKAKQDIHPLACEAAVAAEAANLQGKFWPYHDELFKTDMDQLNIEIFLKIAQSIGLDLDRFKSDFESVACRQKVSSNVEEAIRLGIDGTPTAFLNGREVRDLRPVKLNFLIKYLSASSVH
jgi:predicted DsbA family dithiol-disulfide isomerase/uncharacterized membrane protein